MTIASNGNETVFNFSQSQATMTFHDAEPSVLWRAVYDRNLAKTQQALSTEDVKLINQPYGVRFF